MNRGSKIALISGTIVVIGGTLIYLYVPPRFSVKNVDPLTKTVQISFGSKMATIKADGQAGINIGARQGIFSLSAFPHKGGTLPMVKVEIRRGTKVIRTEVIDIA